MDDFNEPDECDTYPIATVRLPIIGMTCQSCVRNIEENIKTKPGVRHIKVVLSENAGYIDYNPSQTNVEQIAEYIDDMGFECPLTKSIGNTNENILQTRLNVDGMTCQNCVQNIEGNISKQSGIVCIAVSLENKEAIVQYEQNTVNPSEIAAMIEDMGFISSVSDQQKTEIIQYKGNSNLQYIITEPIFHNKIQFN